MTPSVLHVTLSTHFSAGIVNQLRDETRAVHRLGLPWRTVLLTADTISEPYAVKLSGGPTSLAIRIQALRWVSHRHQRFDVLLFRHSKVEPLLWMVSRRFPFWISVHHTKEIEECLLTRPRWKALLCSSIERYLGTVPIRSAAGIIGVTNEIVSYELARAGRSIPAVTLPNGIDVQRITLLPDSRGGIAKLLFIASEFFEWHGLDLILDSIENSKRECMLILVGRLDEASRRRIRSSPRLSSTVVLFSHSGQTGLFELTAKADIGLSSFGLERKGMKEACTLKVREYLSGGLPVYAGHQDTGLPLEFPFFRRGDANIDMIIQQALEWRKCSRCEIRTAAVPWIDKACLLTRAYSWICREYNSRGTIPGADRQATASIESGQVKAPAGQ